MSVHPGQPIDLHDHVVLFGLNHLGLATLRELRRLGEDVVLVAADQRDPLAAEARAAGALVVAGHGPDEDLLRFAAVERARSLVLAADDDVGNLRVALAAQDLNPRLRIVLRLFDQRFGSQIQRLFPDCLALSASAIAAPFFVAAALGDEDDPALPVAGRSLAVRPLAAAAPDVVLPLLDRDGDPFPTAGEAFCLVDRGPAAAEAGSSARSSRRHVPLRVPLALLLSLFSVVDRRLPVLAALLGALAILSAAVFHFFAGLEPLDAFYFTVTVITTTGFGDINLQHAEPALKVYGIVLMLFGACAVAIFYALITDAIVGHSLRQLLGAHRPRLRDHFVVCGLGSVGYRIAAQLKELGLPVAAAEHDENARFVDSARRLGIPVVAGDVRLLETLRDLRAERARCLIVATDDDVANLQTALNALALNPGLRLVVRLFDPDFATRTERAFGLHCSRSVSALAAPAFAAAALGASVLGSLPANGERFVIARHTVAPSSWLTAAPVADVEAATALRVLVVEDGRLARPLAGLPLAAGRAVFLVAAQRGFLGALAACRRQALAPR